ncbi:MAG: pseudouridine synthase [Thermoleophilia bacterium]
MGEIERWPAPGTRIHRALAQAGVASRRRAEELVAEGRVTVNGAVAVIGQPVGPGDTIAVDGRPVRPEPVRVLLLNKPRGVVTTVSDPQGRRTVLDDLPDDVRLFPVGRLDIDTTGVLLLTNDGELTNRLLHPRGKVAKVYEALVDGRVSSETLRVLRSGVELEDGMTHPARVEPMERQHPGGTWLRLEITEGRNRIVKRMCTAVGHPVMRLHRARFAGLGTQGMKPGEWRVLTADELRRVRRAAGLDGEKEAA